MGLLLAAGAQVDARNCYGSTPLHLACVSGAREAAEALCCAGADIDATNNGGWTPLHYALRGGEGYNDAATAAPAFVRSFQRHYGERCPRFLACTYREALQQAQRESKFLLLYLHSAEHQARAWWPTSWSLTEYVASPRTRVHSAHARCATRPCLSSCMPTFWSGGATSVAARRTRRGQAFFLPRLGPHRRLQVSGMLRNSTFPHLALVLLSGPGAKCVAARVACCQAHYSPLQTQPGSFLPGRQERAGVPQRASAGH